MIFSKSVGKIHSVSNEVVSPERALHGIPSPSSQFPQQLCCVCSPSQSFFRVGASYTNDNIINFPDFRKSRAKKPLCNSPKPVSLISDRVKVLIRVLGFLPRKHTSRRFLHQ